MSKFPEEVETKPFPREVSTLSAIERKRGGVLVIVFRSSLCNCPVKSLEFDERELWWGRLVGPLTRTDHLCCRWW